MHKCLLSYTLAVDTCSCRDVGQISGILQAQRRHLSTSLPADIGHTEKLRDLYSSLPICIGAFKVRGQANVDIPYAYRVWVQHFGLFVQTRCFQLVIALVVTLLGHCQLRSSLGRQFSGSANSSWGQQAGGPGKSDGCSSHTQRLSASLEAPLVLL